MKTSEILIEAKKNLNMGSPGDTNTRYVCWAILSTPESAKQTALITRIDVAIGGASESVYSWLVRHGYATDEQLTTKNMQEYRHRWVDAMIDEYQARGD